MAKIRSDIDLIMPMHPLLVLFKFCRRKVICLEWSGSDCKYFLDCLEIEGALQHIKYLSYKQCEK